MLKIVIPSNPITKKNHGRIVKKKTKTGKEIPFMLPSSQYTKYESMCKKYIPKVDRPIDFPINLEVHYYMETRRKCDITNLLQATCDILVKYGIVQDDNYTIISGFDGTRANYDKENPRCEIIITRKKD